MYLNVRLPGQLIKILVVMSSYRTCSPYLVFLGVTFQLNFSAKL